MSATDWLPSLTDLQRERCLRSLRKFTEHTFPIVDPRGVFTPGWHIDAVCEHLEAVYNKQIKNLLINIPPGHMKSMLTCVFFPAWIWAKHPEKRFIFGSYGYDLALRDSRKTNELIQSPQYQILFPDTRVKAANAHEIETIYGGFRLATSVEGVVTGRHSHYQVIDDPLKASEAQSANARNAANEWITQTLSTRLLPGGQRIMIMQRLHEDDPSGEALKSGDWVHLCLPEEYESRRRCIVPVTGWSDPRKTDGELLWPNFFSEDDHARRKRALGSYGTAGQLQQRPAPEEGGILKRSMFKLYKRQNMPENFDMIWQSWDLTLKNTNDYVSGGVFGSVGADVYLIKHVHAQLTFPQTIATMRLLNEQYAREQSAIVIEDAAAGAPAKDTLDLEGVSGISLMRPQGDKIMRVHSIVPFLEAGNFYVPEPESSEPDEIMNRYFDEVMAFPNASHDDQVDMTTQAILWWRKHRGDSLQDFDMSGGERSSPSRLY